MFISINGPSVADFNPRSYVEIWLKDRRSSDSAPRVGVALTALFYFGLIRPLQYWLRKGVVQKSVLQQWKEAVLIMLQLKAQAEIISEYYDKHLDKRYTGTYQLLTPILFMRDPDLIKQITVKDFDYFVDHNQFLPEEREPLWSKNLFSLKGDRWREMRTKLSRAFTNNRMKATFPLIAECAQQFVQYFKDNTQHDVEMRDAFTRFANDVIGSAAFGIRCNSLTHRNNEFYLMGKEATDFTGFWKNIKFIIMVSSPRVAKILGLRMFSTKLCDYFRKIIRINIETREETGLVRPDMIQILMEARNERMMQKDADFKCAEAEESSTAKHRQRLQNPYTDDDLTAQALIFFFAGFSSISTFMCFLTYEIAVNPNVQETLRTEVDVTLEECGGCITFEALVKMKYMDMVVQETLRKWPTTGAIDRVCIKPYTIQPIKKEEVPISLDVGDILWMPIIGVHRHSEFYPNPDKFDPERFSEENRANIKPYTFIPFGSGPRSCIGNRFASVEAKTIMFYLLSNFQITVTEKTRIPPKIRKNHFNLSIENGLWLRLIPRKV